MSMMEILQRGVKFTNDDPDAKAMLASLKEYKVGTILNGEEFTIAVKDGAVSVEKGVRTDCGVAFKMSLKNMCDAIDSILDLMEIRHVGQLVKGDVKDPKTAAHFIAIFPYFDAMTRLYKKDAAFKKMVDDLKHSL